MRHLLPGRNPSEKNVALGLVPSLGSGRAGTPELVIRTLRLVPRMCQLRGVRKGNVALGLVPNLARGRAGTPELVIRKLRLLPSMCQLRGCGQGECSAGACPQLGEGHGRPSGLVILLRSKARPVPRYRAGIQGMGIAAANDPQTLPPTRRPHRRRDGFETRPGRGWVTPTPAGYRSGSTTVRNGNR